MIFFRLNLPKEPTRKSCFKAPEGADSPRDLRSVKPLTENLTVQNGVESVRHVESVEMEQLNRWEMSVVAV